MKYTSLSLLEQVFINTMLSVSLLILCITFLYLLQNKGKKSTQITIFILFLIIIIDTSFLLELHYIDFAEKTYNSTNISYIFDNIPVIFHLILIFLSSIFAIFLLIKKYRSVKNQITDLSIKEGLENLPTGLAFISNDGDIFLSNRTLHNLSFELTGKDLQSGKEFWGDLEMLKKTESCVITSEKPAFILQNNEVWQFSKELITIENTSYFKITASNITEIFTITESTEKLNVNLKNQQKKLKTLIDDIEKNAASQVALSMKVNFHDSFGNLIAETRKDFKEGNMQISSNILGKLENLESVIADLADGKEHNLTLNQIMAFAESLKCKITISGDKSSDILKNSLVLTAINEMLKNAVYHANVTELFVNISEKDTNYEIEISNANTKRIIEIKEGNGLSSLRNKILQYGGKMDITALNNITLKIVIPQLNTEKKTTNV